ncbi:MAG: hypothetical protein J0H52_19410, partial [Comamonadaceae bacterium]|nr:hypothetical protein [Comamonadaceae bacterium]
MSDLTSLLRRFDASDPQQALWESCGLLPSITARQGEAWITTSQHDRLRQLTATKFDWNVGPHLPHDLFTPTVVAELGAFACLAQGAGAASSPASLLWTQLLPLWLADRPTDTDRIPNSSWHEVDINGYRAYSLNVALNAISTKS